MTLAELESTTQTSEIMADLCAWVLPAVVDNEKNIPNIT